MIRTLDAKQISETIEKLCSDNHIDVAHMLIECSLSRSTIDNMKKGSMPSVDKVYKISQYFGCSIGFLVGTERQTTIQSNNTGNIVNGDNGNNSPLTVGKAEQPEDEMQKEISSILSGLTFRERTELMTMIYQFADEHKKEGA